jgi:rRNA maturation RNase YbeY
MKSIPVQFHFLQAITLKDRKLLKIFIQSIFKREQKAFESLTYIFCSDDYLLDINRQYLNHDYYTDIITFDLSEGKGGTTGEIYISIDRVRDNARQFKTSTVEELHRVIFHGALHLCGFKDKTPKEEKRMREKEAEYLKRYTKKKNSTVNMFHVEHGFSLGNRLR